MPSMASHCTHGNQCRALSRPATWSDSACLVGLLHSPLPPALYLWLHRPRLCSSNIHSSVDLQILAALLPRPQICPYKVSLGVISKRPSLTTPGLSKLHPHQSLPATREPVTWFLLFFGGEWVGRAHHRACKICSPTRDWTWDTALRTWNPNH